jgi:HSP20 family molecular chaperone IbpA
MSKSSSSKLVYDMHSNSDNSYIRIIVPLAGCNKNDISIAVNQDTIHLTIKRDDPGISHKDSLIDKYPKMPNQLEHKIENIAWGESEASIKLPFLIDNNLIGVLFKQNILMIDIAKQKPVALKIN